MPIRDELPTYRRVAEVLRQRIESGTYQPDEALPSVAALAREFQVGIDSVSDAQALLRAQRLIVTHRGHPATVRPKPDRQVVVVPAGVAIVCRPATEAEIADLSADAGAWVVVVDGRAYEADTVELHTMNERLAEQP